MPAKAKENANLALKEIRAFLDANPLGQDGKLPTERSLAERFHVSRQSVRRALEVLETEGRIWRKQGAGTFVGARPNTWSNQIEHITSSTDFLEVMEVRLRIEPHLAQLAALRATLYDVARMRDLNKRMEDSGDHDGMELWDSSLHRQIAQSAGNTLFLNLFDVVDCVRQDKSWQRIRIDAQSDITLAVTFQQHRSIVEAIADRDPANAGEAMRRHLMTVYETLTRQTSQIADMNVEALSVVS